MVNGAGRTIISYLRIGTNGFWEALASAEYMEVEPEHLAMSMYSSLSRRWNGSLVVGGMAESALIPYHYETSVIVLLKSSVSDTWSRSTPN